MSRYKVEKSYHKDGDILGKVIATSFYETKEDVFRCIFDEAYKMYYELDNVYEIIIDPEKDNAAIIAEFCGFETFLYSWYCEDTEEAE